MTEEEMDSLVNVRIVPLFNDHVLRNSNNASFLQ